MFLLILIQSCLSVMKYLYLGKTNCANDDDTAYQDIAISDGNPMICSPKIPYIKVSYSDIILKITVLESGRYDGIENLVGFKSVQILKKDDSVTEVKISSADSSVSKQIKIQTIDVLSELDLTFEAFSSGNSNIGTVTFSPNTKIHFNNINVGAFVINGKGTFEIDDFLKASRNTPITINGPGTAIDNNQVLSGRSITLKNCNLTYAGSDGYVFSNLNYNGVEIVKRTDASQPKVKINLVYLYVFKEVIVKDFLEADIGRIYVIPGGGGGGALYIETPETIYFPVFVISNVKIFSDHKLDLKEGQIIQANVPLEMVCLSGRTDEGKKLNVFYQIYLQSQAFACIMSNDISGVEFDPAFLIYPKKVVMSNDIENVIIGPTHFEGMTMLLDVNLVCKDENCAIDGLLIINDDDKNAKLLGDILSYSSNGKMLNKDMSVKKPEYFTITTDGSNFVFEPTKADVTGFDYCFPNKYQVSIALKSFSSASGKTKTRYLFNQDLQIKSLSIDENVEIEFDCNLMIYQELQIPASSAVIDTDDIGAYIIIHDKSVTVNHFPNCGYHRRDNNIQFIYSNMLESSTMVIKNIGAKEGINKVSFVFQDDDRHDKNLTVSKISCCRNVEVYFQSSLLYVNEFTLGIDKATLLPNPDYHPVTYFQMGSYGDGYIRQETKNQKFLPNEYKNLYFHSGVQFSSKGYTNPYKINGVLYIDGNIYSNENPSVYTQDLIIVNSNSASASAFPKFSVDNTFYTTLKGAASLFSNVDRTTKAVITAMNKNVNISVKNDCVIVDNDESNPIELKTMEVLSFYLPADDKCNTIRLSISGNLDKTLNFELISTACKSKSAKKDALIKLILDDSLAANSLINGKIGYAFDEALNGSIIYQFGENGVETDVKPEFLPISETEMEPFIYGNDDGPDDDDDITSPVISEETSSITSEDTNSITNEETSSISSNENNSITNEEPSKKLKPGIIAAIVIGVLVVVICIVVAAVFIVKARRKNKTPDISPLDSSLTGPL